MRRLLLLGMFVLLAVPAASARLPIVASQDLWPVYAPDGNHIAFTRVFQRSMQLLVVDTSSRRVTRLATNAGKLDPSWSSDGSRLAYSSGGVLYTIRPDGTDRKRYVAPIRSFAPAWRPHSTEIAYVTERWAPNLGLWVAGQVWTTDAIGAPAWSPDGSTLAFQREDGIYTTTGTDEERRVARAVSPGPPAFSRDGSRIAYVSQGALYTVAAAGGTPTLVARNQATGIRPSWSPDDATVRVGGSFDPATGDYAASGPRPACPGHLAIRVDGRTVTGSCTISGTTGADVIEGTGSWGDAILAGSGNDRIHANDRHTDRIACGPGRDTVWADKTDRLSGCEIVHR